MATTYLSPGEASQSVADSRANRGREEVIEEQFEINLPDAVPDDLRRRIGDMR